MSICRMHRDKSEPGLIHVVARGLFWVPAHPTDAQLDLVLGNKEASLTP